MKNIIFLIFFFTVFSLSAQSTFQLDNGRLQTPGDVVQTSDNGYLIGGMILDTLSGQADVYGLVKIDSQLNEQWTRLYYDSGHDSYITSLFQDSNGNYIFSGRPDGTINTKCLMAKLSPNGYPIWAKSFALPGFQSYFTSPKCIEIDDGNYAMVFNQNSWNTLYLSFVKVDSNGNIIWEKNYFDSLSIFGKCNSIIQTDDRGFLLSGEDGYQTCFLMKTDSVGNPLWSKVYIVGSYYLPATYVKETFDKGFIVTSSWYYTAGGTGGISNVLKLDSLGQVQWTKTFSGNKSYYLESILQISDSNFVAAGSVGDYSMNTQKLFIVKMTQLGDTVWTRTYLNTNGLNLTGLKIEETTDGGLILLNQSWLLTQLLKLNSGGDLYCGQSSVTTDISQHTCQIINVTPQVDTTIGQTTTFLSSQFYPPSTSISCISLGSGENLSIKRISIYPNPTPDGKIKISSANKILKIEIINPIGKVIGNYMGTQTEITIPETSGIYFVKVTASDGGIYIKKVLRN